MTPFLYLAVAIAEAVLHVLDDQLKTGTLPLPADLVWLAPVISALLIAVTARLQALKQSAPDDPDADR